MDGQVSTMTEKLVDYTTKEGVAIITLTAPERANTYSHEMMRQLDEAVLEARFDEDVYTILLTGDGDRFFCAGADISMLNESEPYFKYNFCLHANETLNRLEQTPKLVIAALNGHTVGGGLEIAMAADMRLAWRPTGDGKEGKLGLPEINLGVLPGTGGTQRLSRLIGKARAIDWMVSGDLQTFDTGVELGLINEIIEAENVETFQAEAFEFARQFCPPNKASKAAAHIKRAVQSGWEVDFNSGLAIERELQQRLFESEDAKIGLKAYIEKDKPEFTGN